MSDLVRDIKSSGYYETTISPLTFVENRLELSELVPTLEKCQVHFVGREFPRIDRTHLLAPDRMDSTSHESRKLHYLEAWRFYRSGQFTDLRAVHTDWLDQFPGGPPIQDWKKGEYLYIEHVLWAFAEVFEFGARLSNSKAGDKKMVITLGVGGLRGRRLTVADQFGRIDYFGGTNPARIDKFEKEYVVSCADLLADSKSLGIDAAREVFDVFGRNLPKTLLAEWLDDLLRRR